MKALILAPFSPQALKRLEGRMEVIYQSWLDTRRLLSPEEMAKENCYSLLEDKEIPFAAVAPENPSTLAMNKASILKVKGVTQLCT